MFGDRSIHLAGGVRVDKIIYFDYCACVIFFILLISTIFRGMTKGKLNHYFLAMLVFSIFSVIADIGAVTLDNMGAGNVAAKYIFHTLYLFFHSITSPLYAIYLMKQTDSEYKFYRSSVQRIIFLMPLAVVLLALLCNSFWHIVFYLDGTDTYIRGDFFGILYLTVAFYIIFGMVNLYRYRKLFSKSRYFALMFVFPLMITSVFIQFFFPKLLVEMFASACGLLFISMMIQRPEETIDIETGLGKLSAYARDMKRIFTIQKPIQIILVNVTNYQSIRSMLGYEGMNEMLHAIADQMVAFNRKQRIEAELYYLGVGKFRFVVDYRHFDKTEKTAEAINTFLKKDFHWNKMELALTACVCIAKCPQDISDVDALLAFGNDLNTSKYNGKVLYASQIFRKEYYDIRKDIDRILEHALTEHKFSVYYQPIYSVEEKRFQSAEALLRLQDDRYGFISPEIFIPAAEKSGAIHRIGAFVLEEVCRFIASEEYQSLHLDYIEINLSVAQCMQNDLASQVLEILERYQVKPDQINLEITETAVSYSQKAMMDNLNLLTEAGIHFSLDDFGTGYSNMWRIATLPLHIVKLDKSFTDVEENPRLLIVLQNTIKMIKDMNLKIVVEGIETERLVRQFSELQCEYIQGYYYSKPIPEQEFIQFIQERADGSSFLETARQEAGGMMRRMGSTIE